MSVHITHYFFRLKWLNVLKRRLYFHSSLIYQIRLIHMFLFLSDKFHLLRPIHYYNLRSNLIMDYVVPFARLLMFRKSFLHIGSHFWNSLPVEITSSAEVAIFKCRLKQFVLGHNPSF